MRRRTFPLGPGLIAKTAQRWRLVLLLCALERALDFLFEHVAVSIGVTLRQISTYL